MTPQEFDMLSPLLIGWIEERLKADAAKSSSVSESGFSRLPLYFKPDTLQSAKFIVADILPMPPLTEMGLEEFAAFENGNFDGITYLDTFYVKRSSISESLFFHELIHIIQWRILGAQRFLRTYAEGLLRFGYANSPLEAMAYKAESDFKTSHSVFDAEIFVRARLSLLP